MTDWIGQQLGNYHLVRLLGEGGFAEVYLGEHIHLGTKAAIKVLHTQLTADDIEAFRYEARTIAQLEHPHIVRVLDFGVEGKTPYLVMSYASNGTLRHLHPKGTRLSLTTVLPYIKQIADALQYAHDEKVIHRDVKPENMLIGKRHEILLSDFGIAVMAQSSHYQNPQDMAGTITYMAPEQIQGSLARPATSIPSASSSTNGFPEPVPFRGHLQRWLVNTSLSSHLPYEKSCRLSHLLLRK
jgi:eukaryotic-like serine/threonine-protein kinase